MSESSFRKPLLQLCAKIDGGVRGEADSSEVSWSIFKSLEKRKYRPKLVKIEKEEEIHEK